MCGSVRKFSLFYLSISLYIKSREHLHVFRFTWNSKYNTFTAYSLHVHVFGLNTLKEVHILALSCKRLHSSRLQCPLIRDCSSPTKTTFAVVVTKLETPSLGNSSKHSMWQAIWEACGRLNSNPSVLSTLYTNIHTLSFRMHKSTY